MVSKPAGATPHVHVAFVRFGAETCAKKMCDCAISWSCFLEIVEGRATLLAPKAIDESILQLKGEITQKFKNKTKENVKGRRWKREEEEQEKRQTRGRGAREALYTP